MEKDRHRVTLTYMCEKLYTPTTSSKFKVLLGEFCEQRCRN